MKIAFPFSAISSVGSAGGGAGVGAGTGVGMGAGAGVGIGGDVSELQAEITTVR